MKGGEKGMNAAALLNTPQPTQKASTSKTKQPVENQAGKEQDSKFAKLLEGASSETTSTAPTKKSVEPSGKEDITPSQSKDLETLLKDIEQLLGMLPIEDGYIDSELLQNPDVLALLHELSPQLQQLLKSFIQSGQSFEQLLAQTTSGSKEQLGLLLLTLYQLESKGQFPYEFKQTDFLKTLQSQLNEVFKVQIDQPSSNAAVLLSKLIQTLEKKTEDGQLVGPNRVELKQIIQRVLHGSSTNQDAGSQQTSQQEQNKVVTMTTSTSTAFNEDTFDQLVAGSIKEGGSVNRIQQYVLHVGTQSGQAVSEEQILKQLQTIMKQSKFSASPNGTSQLMIRLHPEHLGSLTIKLTESNGEMMARIIASSAAAKDMIESNLHALRHVFTTQNINVEKFEIQYQGDSQFEDAKKEGNEQEGQSKRNNDGTKLQQEDDEDASDSHSFKDELLNIMV